jgi:hypothetical protein
LFVGWNLEESDPSKENFNGDPAFWLLGSWRWWAVSRCRLRTDTRWRHGFLFQRSPFVYIAPLPPQISFQLQSQPYTDLPHRKVKFHHSSIFVKGSQRDITLAQGSLICYKYHLKFASLLWMPSRPRFAGPCKVVHTVVWSWLTTAYWLLFCALVWYVSVQYWLHMCEK